MSKTFRALERSISRCCCRRACRTLCGEDHLARFILALVHEHLDLGDDGELLGASGASRRLTRR